MTQEAKTIVGISVATILLVVGGAFLLTKSKDSNSSAPTTKIDSSILVREDSNKIATDSAKVTLVEFGDYQCPACAEAHPYIKQILANYKEKINFVFRNFPLSMHENAQIAAEAAEAAGEQDKFWQMYDILYEKQSDWANSGQPIDKFTEYANQLGLDVNKFTESVKTNKFTSKIQTDVNDGIQAGVSATPTFYINGEKLVGVPYIEIKNKIDSLLE